MVNYCRVTGCYNRSDREKDLNFYRLPKIITNQGEQTRKLSEERRRLWLAELNQNFKGKNLDNIRVCSAHFVSGKRADLYYKDDPDWVPSLCMSGPVTATPTKDRCECHENLTQKKLERDAMETSSFVEHPHVWRSKDEDQQQPVTTQASKNKNSAERKADMFDMSCGEEVSWSETTRIETRQKEKCITAEPAENISSESIPFTAANVRKKAGKKPYKCSICNISCPYLSTFKIHMRTHTGEKPYKCGCCNAAFSQLSNLKVHMRTHTGERPHRCSLCMASFAQVSSLTAHIRTHMGEKPYKCHLCCCTYSDSYKFNRHVKSHSVEKRFMCKVCDASFFHSSSLSWHRKIHKGVNLQKCSVCNATYSQASQLKDHVKIHISSIEVPEKKRLCNNEDYNGKGSELSDNSSVNETEFVDLSNGSSDSMGHTSSSNLPCVKEDKQELTG